jgi:hypothetical protein
MIGADNNKVFFHQSNPTWDRHHPILTCAASLVALVLLFAVHGVAVGVVSCVFGQERYFALLPEQTHSEMSQSRCRT